MREGFYALSFVGVAIYYKSPKWPYTVAAVVQVDGGTPTLIDLQDYSTPDVGEGPETVNTDDVWGVSGLKNRQHTLTISFPPDQRFLALDGLV